ncbi:MAG: hypothetical protein PHH49_07920 [Candidatus Omnitrophica bacterium]|nr:hypothetical protein [Candidatus Omnitrophota bacterium]MDD5488864.1 hypothetical protein [Candidatus Omnitrophota bacterium]
MVLLCLSVISLLLVMAALQDIFHNDEPSLDGEWLVVRYGVLCVLFFHVWVGYVILRKPKE